jgi:hypothetical protein
LVGCGDESEPSEIVIANDPNDTFGDPAVHTIRLHPTGELTINENGTRQAQQRYRRNGTTFEVATEAIVINSGILQRLGGVEPGQQHLTVATLTGSDGSPEGENTALHDWLFAMQVADDSGWQSVLPPPSYDWRQMARINYAQRDRPQKAARLQLTGEVCRYRAVAEMPQRRCEFVSRVIPVKSARIRMLPFPAWPSAVMSPDARVVWLISSAENTPDTGQ